MRGFLGLHVESDKLLTADVFSNSQNICLEMYWDDPAYFLSVQGSAWKAALKKSKVQLHLLTDKDMSIMVEKGIRSGIYDSLHQYAQASNKHMKDYDKNIESSYLKDWKIPILYT